MPIVRGLPSGCNTIKGMNNICWTRNEISHVDIALERLDSCSERHVRRYRLSHRNGCMSTMLYRAHSTALFKPRLAHDITLTCARILPMHTQQNSCLHFLHVIWLVNQRISSAFAYESNNSLAPPILLNGTLTLTTLLCVALDPIRGLAIVPTLL